MGLFSGIGKVLKKVAKVALPVAAIAAPFIPGVGGLVAKGVSAVGGLFGASKGSQSDSVSLSDGSSFAAEQPAGVANAAGQLPPVSVSGSRPTDWGSVLGGVASAGSALLGYRGQQETNAANAAMANRQMEFQAGQTGTAYQRGTADMQAAGLNPMLAYSQGGAGSGSGASAVMGNEMGAGVSSGLQAAQTLAGLKQMSAQTENVSAQTENLAKDLDVKDSQVAVNNARVNEIIQDTHTSGASAKQMQQQVANLTLAAEGTRLGNQYARDTMKSRVAEAASQAQSVEARAALEKLKQPGASNEAEFESSPVGRASRYINFGSEQVSSALALKRLVTNPNRSTTKRTSETIKDLEGGGSYTRERVERR